MQKIAQIILRAYLRRNPVHLRLSRFNYFTRYAWLKNVLAELKPELFPTQRDAEPPEPAVSVGVDETELAQLIHPLMGRQLQGSQGRYQIECFIGQRGQSLLFEGIRLESQQPVAIQLYRHVIQQDLLFEPLVQQRRVEVWQRQGQFSDQAWLNLADGRLPVFRVPRPLDAIADEREAIVADHLVYSSFLVTEAQNTLPTLRQVLREQGALAPYQVRSLLGQVLQTLDFLHRHKFVFASGQIQPGLVHGNLSLDTLLWQVNSQGEAFLYLCDLQLWERLFGLLQGTVLPSIQPTAAAVQVDLQKVAQVGWAMLNGESRAEQDATEADPQPGLQIEPQPQPQDPETGGRDTYLEQWLTQLHRTPMTAAEARQRLLRLPPLYEPAEGLTAIAPQAAPPPQRRWSKVQLLAGLSGLALLAALFWSLFPRDSQVAQSEALPMSCCLAEIGAIPASNFVYTAPEGGTWRYVTQQRNLLERGQTLASALWEAQSIQLDYQPSNDPLEAIELVRWGEADFAVIAAPEDLLTQLPLDMVSETIAYDGLAVVIPFSYADRRKGLPTALNGQLTLAQVQALYSQPLDLWSDLGGSRVGIQRLIPENLEAQIIFEQRVLQSASLAGAEIDAEPLAPIPLLRSIIEGFEEQGAGPVAFSPFSQIRGQCSVYPLALAAPGKAAVQPLRLASGQPISPKTDLCDRKGALALDVAAFQTQRYPLSYPIAVIYPKDNRRSAVGRKFVDLMQTREAQSLLNDAGLVPALDLWRLNDS